MDQRAPGRYNFKVAEEQRIRVSLTFPDVYNQGKRFTVLLHFVYQNPILVSSFYSVTIGYCIMRGIFWQQNHLDSVRRKQERGHCPSQKSPARRDERYFTVAAG